MTRGPDNEAIHRGYDTRPTYELSHDDSPGIGGVPTNQPTVTERSHKNAERGLCECGCGQRTPIAKRSDRRRGWRAGQPIRFVSGHNNVFKRKPGVRNRKLERRRWRAKYPEKSRAHYLVQFALKDGRLVRPDSCSICGTPGPVEAHHADYSRPLDVLWLCKACHLAIERHLKERGIAA